GLARLDPQIASRRRVLAPRLPYELESAGRVGLIQLDRPPGQGPVAEGRAATTLEGVPHLHRHAIVFAGRLADEPAPRQGAGDDELLDVRGSAAREQRHTER